MSTLMFTRALAAVGLSVLLCAPSISQELQIDPDGSPLKCLARTGAALSPIEYPTQELRLKAGAMVTLRITFTAPDLEPLVEVVGNTGRADFAVAARKHVEGYRLPCLRSQDTPLVATQEFEFDPVAQEAPRAGAVDPEMVRWRDCLRVDGLPFLQAKKIDYPRAAVRRQHEGVVLAQTVFTSPAEPPKVNILYDAGSLWLVEAVEKHAAMMRMGCLEPGKTITFLMPFRFRMEGSESLVLKDLKLAQFVRIIDPKALERPDIKQSFDLGGMGCPFQLSFKTFQPYSANAVGEMGSSDVRRQPLLAWMRSVPLAFKDSQLKQVMGQPIVISIPCGTLDLR